MLHALITFAVETAEEHAEPSKTPFYLAGALLALWAVAVSFLGIRRHENWPGSEMAARGVMGISVVLVAITLAAAVLSS